MISSNAFAYSVATSTPGIWGSGEPGSGAEISWSLMPESTFCGLDECSGNSIHALSSFMPIGYEQVIHDAFDAWSSVSNINFLQVEDDGADVGASTLSGDIRIGGHSFGVLRGILGHAYYPPENGLSIAGDLHFNSDLDWALTDEMEGVDLFSIALHEIGHSIGLGHSDDINSIMYPVVMAELDGLQQDDIAGIQYLYGASVTAVPLPGSMLLFISGLTLLTGLKKRYS